MDENEWGKYVKILPMSENIALLHWVMDDLINLLLESLLLTAMEVCICPTMLFCRVRKIVHVESGLSSIGYPVALWQSR